MPPITWGLRMCGHCSASMAAGLCDPSNSPSILPSIRFKLILPFRHVGYWVEGFVSLAASEHPVLVKAAEALKTVITSATAGTKCSDLARLAAEKIMPCSSHAITAGSIGNGIGLSLEEEPRLSPNSEDALEPGGVYTVRVGASDGQEHHGIVSAIVAVHENENEVLWSAV